MLHLRVQGQGEVIRVLPCFLPLLEDLPVREGMEGGRRSRRSARPPVSVPSARPRARLADRGGARTRESTWGEEVGPTPTDERARA